MLKAFLLLLHQLQFLVQLPDSSAASCIPWTMAVCHSSIFRLHEPSLRVLLLPLMTLMLLNRHADRSCVCLTSCGRAVSTLGLSWWLLLLLLLLIDIQLGQRLSDSSSRGVHG